jgi:glyoxylase-like metal-dependent hydrolase (beta-lactamase superfamily II)
MSMEKVPQVFDRRSVLSGIAGSAAAAFLSTRAYPQAPAGNPARSGSLAVISEGIRVVSGLGGNIVIYSDDAGVILVDGGAAEHTNSLLLMIRELFGSDSIQTLFNTHWHLDQVGSNGAIRATGANIIAHAKTLARLSTPYYLPDEDRYQPALPPEAQPTQSFYKEGAIDTSGQPIRYGYLLEAHTDGDIYVRFEDANVIAAGDAISPLRDPALDWFGGGWLGGRIESLKLLLEISDSDTQFVPSYGPVVDRDYVQGEHDLMLELFDILFERIRAGESADDINRSGALETLPRRFENPAKLLYDAHKSMWGHYNTLSHDIV